jgi:putative isomerase
MRRIASQSLFPAVSFAISLCFAGLACGAQSQAGNAALSLPPEASRRAPAQPAPPPRSTNYSAVQQRLAQGWNTWDTHSVTTQVLLPEGLAIHLGLKHNTTLAADAFLRDALIGRLQSGAEQVQPGPHAWNGGYTDLRISWEGHRWRIQSAHDAGDVVMLATPLPTTPISAVPPTLIVSVDFLWNRPGTTVRRADFIETHGALGSVPVYCICVPPQAPAQSPPPTNDYADTPVAAPYFSLDFTAPVGISTGRRRTLAEIQAIIDRQRHTYETSIASGGQSAPIRDAIETTLGWDTIYDPDEDRVISPVSRLWSVNWGGWVLFDWDTFFAATLASIGDRDLAYANALEILREETPEGFVPNYARPGGWKSFDRSEPPVGAITVLGLYRQFQDRWFLEDAFAPLLRWNRWWNEHRQTQGYLAWGSDGDTHPANPDDHSRGTRQGAILESGLDNSPMYDDAVYDPQTHLLQFADVGLMSLYIADCDALAEIADVLAKPEEAKELRARSARYRASLATLWSERDAAFLNKDLHTGQFNRRLSPTNFYPLLAHAATPAQAQGMIQKHLLNPREFWGQWVIPSIARDDPAFSDQNYWRGRIWGPMNFLVYLGLRNYAGAHVRRQFAEKSYALFLREWTQNGHVHENYNALTGSGDDVRSSDRFYHWGALLGYVEYLDETRSPSSSQPSGAPQRGGQAN